MREGWQEKKLGDVLTLEYGKPLPPSSRTTSGKYAVYGANGVKDRSDRYYVDKPSIIVGRKGSAGEITLTEDRFWPLDVTYFLKFDDKKYDLQFLYHLLSLQELTKLAKGVKPGINRNEVYAKTVRVPSLPEQQRMVAILDEAFAGLTTATANAEKNLKNARELFDSHLNSVFAHEGSDRKSVPLGEVCSISSKLVDPRLPKFCDLPHLGAGNMASKTGELSGIKTAREEGLKSGKFLFDKTMVLYSKIRPYLMKASRPDFEGLCSADVYPLSPNPAQLDRNFLFHLLMSKDFTDFAVAGSDRAGMPKVNRGHLFKYRGPLPGIEEQQQLAGKVDAISVETNHLKAFYERRLDDIEELKQSILQKAFLGELASPGVEAEIRAAAPSRKLSLISISGISTTDLHAGIIAIAYQKHQGHPKQNTFGHVKAEKISHMVEARTGIDFERKPVKDAAGPNDYRHLKKVESRAEKAGFFSVRQSASGSYTFIRKNRFNELIDKTRKCLGEHNDVVDEIIDELLPLDTQQAEIFTTVYAAWNNLLIDGKVVTDEAIVCEAREDWHPDKMKISRDRFFAAIDWMRSKGITPTGVGKKVLDRDKG